MAKETFKMVELNGRKFRIEKFNAFTGSYIIYTLMQKALPMMLESQAKVDGKALSESLPTDRMQMTRQEFEQLQKDCLDVCYETLPAGNTKVLGVNGNFAVSGLEQDTGTVVALTMAALIFNVSSFFADGGLTSIMSMLGDIKLPNLKM